MGGITMQQLMDTASQKLVAAGVPQTVADEAVHAAAVELAKQALLDASVTVREKLQRVGSDLAASLKTAGGLV